MCWLTTNESYDFLANKSINRNKVSRKDGTGYNISRKISLQKEA